MSNYKILQYSYDRAKELDVEIKTSKKGNKKIDVYKDGKFICSIGSLGYKDYPTYLLENYDLAVRKRRAYKKRHENDRHIRGTAGYYADKLLW
jgi:hypothetical protein